MIMIIAFLILIMLIGGLVVGYAYLDKEERMMEYPEIIACRNRKCKYHMTNSKDVHFEDDLCPDLCVLASVIISEEGKCHDMEERQ